MGKRTCLGHRGMSAYPKQTLQKKAPQFRAEPRCQYRCTWCLSSTPEFPCPPLAAHLLLAPPGDHNRNFATVLIDDRN